MDTDNVRSLNSSKDVYESSGAIHAPTRVRAKRNRKQTTVGFHALPAYLKDNEFIRGYYRRVLPVKDSFKSLFGLHNETGNIYTHLFGALNKLRKLLS
jgi:adiponectin receptor